jgi:hypothetical protein
MRETPSVESKILGSLGKYSTVNLIRRTKNKFKVGTTENYWFYCDYLDKKFWVYGDFITEGSWKPRDVGKDISDGPKLTPNYLKLMGKEKHISWSSLPPGIEPNCTIYSYDFRKNYVIWYGIFCVVYRIDSMRDEKNRIIISTTAFASDAERDNIHRGSKMTFDIVLEDGEIVLNDQVIIFIENPSGLVSRIIKNDCSYE